MFDAITVNFFEDLNAPIDQQSNKGGLSRLELELEENKRLVACKYYHAPASSPFPNVGLVHVPMHSMLTAGAP